MWIQLVFDVLLVLEVSKFAINVVIAWSSFRDRGSLFLDGMNDCCIYLVMGLSIWNKAWIIPSRWGGRRFLVDRFPVCWVGGCISSACFLRFPGLLVFEFSDCIKFSFSWCFLGHAFWVWLFSWGMAFDWNSAGWLKSFKLVTCTMSVVLVRFFLNFWTS